MKKTKTKFTIGKYFGIAEEIELIFNSKTKKFTVEYLAAPCLAGSYYEGNDRLKANEVFFEKALEIKQRVIEEAAR